MHIGLRKQKATWTDDELRILQQYSKTHSACEITAMINKISSVTRTRATVLNVASRRGYTITNRKITATT